MSRPSENGSTSSSNNDPSTDLASLITQVGTTWAVKAQPNEPFFRVFIDISGVITSCDCLGFISTRMPCIHMCMLKWYNKGIIVASNPNQQAPHFAPPHQQPSAPHPMHQTPPAPAPPAPPPPTQQVLQPVQQTQPVQQPRPLPQQPQSRALTQPKSSKRGRPRKVPFTPMKHQCNHNTHASNAPTRPIQPAMASATQPVNQTVNTSLSPAANRAANLPVRPSPASPLQQPSPLQSPTSSAIQQQLQLQLTRHLQQQRPSVQAKETQKQPEQTKDIDKLVALLTELNKKYEKIKRSCSTSPPSLPPNMDSDIALRGKKIALEAQSAMRMGVGGKNLEKFILDMLEKERRDIAAKTSSSSASSSSPSSSSYKANTSSPLTSNAATTTAAAAATASTPISISSGCSTPTVSSPLAKSTASSPALRKLVMEPLNAFNKASTAPPAATKLQSTAMAPTTPPSTISPSTASPKAPTVSTTSMPTSSPESPSSAGKKRRSLPAFALSPFLKTKQEIKMPEKRHVKKEGCSSQHRPYPIVEPVEGYDAAIKRMIDNMKNEQNSSSDPWNISSSEKDEDDD